MASTYSSGTTGQDIFEKAITLMGELSDSGQADWGDTQEYKFRTLNILNVLRGEVYPYSDTYRNQRRLYPGKRPVCEALTSLDDEIGIDDGLAQTVLPYGLAAALMLDENDAMAAFFQQRYEELLRKLGSGVPSEWDAITDVYGGGAYIEYGQYGSW